MWNFSTLLSTNMRGILDLLKVQFLLAEPYVIAQIWPFLTHKNGHFYRVQPITS